jgi:hypothetical protein
MIEKAVQGKTMLKWMKESGCIFGHVKQKLEYKKMKKRRA